MPGLSPVCAIWPVCLHYTRLYLPAHVQITYMYVYRGMITL